MSRFLSERYRLLDAYVPGEQPQDQAYIKLNTNESPYPPSPAVLRAVNREEAKNLRLYPDPECGVLREKLAECYGVTAEQVYIANGSDDILNFAFLAFGGKGAVFPDITYGFYRVYGDLYGIDYTEISLRADFTVDGAAYEGTGKFTVLANPNAPTGISMASEKIERIAASNPDSVVLVDEAYVDFGGESVLPLVKKYDNLLVVRTYSKSRCLAGARLGFAIGSRGLIDDLNKLKYSTNPYAINRLTLAAAAAALSDGDYYLEKCLEIEKTRAYTEKRLKELGFDVLPSSANFVFAAHREVPGEELYRELKKRGVLVRHFSNSRIREFNRITIGTRKQMDALLRVVAAILEERK